MTDSSSARARVSVAIKDSLTIERKLELLIEDVTNLLDETSEKYIERCTSNMDIIILLLRGGEKYTGALIDLDSYDYKSAYERFRRIRNHMYRIFEDIRTIYALKIYPIEEKMELKSKLSNFEFIDVLKCLDEADDNIANKHYKDSINRGRDALEKLVSNILLRLNKTPSYYFSTDIGTLSGMDFINKESKRLIEATYSYLSEVGAHG